MGNPIDDYPRECVDELHEKCDGLSKETKIQVFEAAITNLEFAIEALRSEEEA
ncbi:MAG: hypothetical protein WCZ86_06165 [Desulfurivibrionaceae bacterium]